MKNLRSTNLVPDAARKHSYRALALFAFAFAALPHAAAMPTSAQAASPITQLEADYLVNFGDGTSTSEETGLTLHEFTLAAAATSGRLFNWSEETDERLRKRRVRLLGQRTVPTASFHGFLQATMLISDFVCTEIGEGDAAVRRIEPASEVVAPQSIPSTNPLISDAGDHYVMDFGESLEGKDSTLYQFLVACGTVAGLQFTWSADTESLLKERRIRLIGKKAVEKAQFYPFLTSLMSVSEMTCSEFGTGDFVVIRIDPVPGQGTETAPPPPSTEGHDQKLLLRFGAEGEPARLSLFDVVQQFAKAAGESFTTISSQHPPQGAGCVHFIEPEWLEHSSTASLHFPKSNRPGMEPGEAAPVFRLPHLPVVGDPPLTRTLLPHLPTPLNSSPPSSPPPRP